MNDEEVTVSTAKHPYIIKNNNTVDNQADEVVIEGGNTVNAIDDNNTILAEVLIVPWIVQEWLDFM